jgi:flagellar hook-associated protein 3 FlgL
MINSLSPSAQQFLNNLTQINTRMQNAQQQLSTGLQMTQVSDSPDQVSILLQARANLSSAQQVQSNLSRFTTEVDGGEQAMQSAVTLFDSVQTLGAEGNTDTASAASRATLAQQVGSVLQQMVGLAGTQVEGRYIFSGDSDQTPPYTLDTSQNPPVLSGYLGSASTRLAQHPNGTTFTVAETAQTIFDSANPATNAFSAIQNLQTALASNDDTAIQTAVSGLSGVGDYLNQQLAFYGATQDKLSEANDYGQTLQTQLQSQISNLQDADMATAIETMTEAQTQQTAALQSRAQIPRTTLFDFLG